MSGFLSLHGAIRRAIARNTVDDDRSYRLMIGTKRISRVTFPLFLALIVAACGDSASEDERRDVPDTTNARADSAHHDDGDASSPDSTVTASDGTDVEADADAGANDSLDISAEGTEGAVAVVRDYYRAINEGDYRRAYGYWGSGGEASGKTFGEFSAGFAKTATSRVTIDSVSGVDAAMGSRFVEIGVTIEAATSDGKKQRFRGTYSLRRTVVDGSTPEQRRWHFYDSEIRQIR